MAVGTHFLMVGLGGALGAMARHGLNSLKIDGSSVNDQIFRLIGLALPYTTLAANLLGGLMIGILAGCFAHFSQWSYELRLFLIVGVLGGFTTFSSFSLENILLFEKGAWGSAIFYMVLSVAGSLAATLAGLVLIRWIAGDASSGLPLS
ncbi:MAG: CrcB family protein [Alphaproteobacteria bacterium]|nr:CrcB family protein [Alphaproteobacteria bacterium]